MDYVAPTYIIMARLVKYVAFEDIISLSFPGIFFTHIKSFFPILLDNSLYTLLATVHLAILGIWQVHDLKI
jgi:hypothetical protein